MQATGKTNAGYLYDGRASWCELAKLMQWWRDAYKDAYEVFTVGHFGTIRKHRKSGKHISTSTMCRVSLSRSRMPTSERRCMNATRWPPPPT